MSEKITIIGLGQFGMRVAKQLTQRGADVLAIDRDLDKVEMIKDEVAYAVALDSTNIKALHSQNIEQMDAVFVAIGENIKGLLLTTVNLLEMNVKRIITRAVSEEQKTILSKLGVQEIISPEDEISKTIAEKLINPTFQGVLHLTEEIIIAEVRVPLKIAYRTIAQSEFQLTYSLKLITVKRSYEEVVDNHKREVYHILPKIDIDTIIQPTDRLIVLGKISSIEYFINMNS